MTRNRLLSIVAVSFAIRAAMVFWWSTGAYISPQVSLSVRYFQEGYAIAAGWGYSTSEQPVSELSPQQQQILRGEQIKTAQDVPRPASYYGETLHPPGMSLLVAVMHRIFGGDANLPTMIFGALLDTAAAAILYLMVRGVWSEPVAFGAALTYALFLPQAYAATADRLPNGLVTFFLIAGFASVLRGLRAGNSRSYLWFAVSGLIVGLGGYMRPDYDLLAIGLFPFLWLFTRRFRTAAQATIIMLSVTVITLLPWAIRNHNLFGQWTFTSSAVGSSLVQGLGEFSNPWGVGYSDAWLTRQAKAQGFKSAWTVQADNYFNDLFARDVREHPAAYVATIVKRLPLALAPAHLFGYVNPSKTQTFSQLRDSGIDRYQALLKRPLYVIAAYWEALIFAVISFGFLLCSVNMLWAERQRWRLVSLLMAPHVYGIATHLLSEAQPRYLLPTTFSIMIGFAYSVQAGGAGDSSELRVPNRVLARS